MRRAEGGAKNLGVFRVNNNDFTPKNHIFPNCGGRREHFWGISCEKSRFYAQKSYFFHFRGAAPGTHLDPPLGTAYPSRVSGFTPVFGRVHVAHLLSFLCCVVFIVFIVCLVYPKVPSFSRLSFLNCTFGFLWRLYR